MREGALRVTRYSRVREPNGAVRVPAFVPVLLTRVPAFVACDSPCSASGPAWGSCPGVRRRAAHPVAIHSRAY